MEFFTPKIEYRDFLLSLQQPFWEPIGRFVFSFGMLERFVDEQLSGLMEIDYHNNGQYVLSELDFLTRARLLNVYVRKDDNALQSEMKALFQKLEDLNAFRNNLVHGAWTEYLQTDPEEGSSWTKMGLSRRFHPQVFSVRRDEIEDNTAAVIDLGTTLAALCKQINEARKRAEPAP